MRGCDLLSRLRSDLYDHLRIVIRLPPEAEPPPPQPETVLPDHLHHADLRLVHAQQGGQVLHQLSALVKVAHGDTGHTKGHHDHGRGADLHGASAPHRHPQRLGIALEVVLARDGRVDDRLVLVVRQGWVLGFPDELARTEVCVVRDHVPTLYHQQQNLERVTTPGRT